MSYLSVTRQDFHFRPAVCGGGITDWDMLNMSSDVSSTGAELAGGAPWTMEPDSMETRRSSAVWHMKETKTPILILHSERDERVPLSQATAFHHGCLCHNVPCEMVTYPREPYVVAERLHRIDMLNRIKRFYDLHLQ